jgi:penicillin-binding protein 2
LLPSREWKQAAHRVTWYPGETVITGIGQGYTLATPLQLALATATLSRNGYLVRPRIVGKVEDPISRESVEVVDPAPTTTARTTPNNWQYIVDAMAEVVHGKRGTARRVGEQTGYRFAGKTGTSQLFQIGQNETVDNDEVAEHLRDHALFIAFAPLVDPTIAVAVVMENGGSGSTAAAPVARKLLDHYLDHGQAIVTSANSG